MSLLSKLVVGKKICIVEVNFVILNFNNFIMHELY